ncbi:hypothetical protein VXQ00_18510 [Acinetobacter baumannii]|uniref:hypothetical protein n=1 Tax=Acinetobacter baumannii TaxID=470 RepID=UPI003A878CAD
MEYNFIDELKEAQMKLNISQKAMCSILFNVPFRTYQSWLLGEKVPPKYYQDLIVFRLRSYIKNPVDGI